MLFQGEEWGSQAPFPFFCDFHGELADAVRKGRRKEFEGAYAKYGDDVPDPLSEDSFTSAKIDWSEPKGNGAKRLGLVKRLLDTRRRELVPHLKDARFGSAKMDERRLLTAHWKLADGKLHLVANLSDEPVKAGAPAGMKLWGNDASETLAPWSVIWSRTPNEG